MEFNLEKETHLKILSKVAFSFLLHICIFLDFCFYKLKIFLKNNNNTSFKVKTACKTGAERMHEGKHSKSKVQHEGVKKHISEKKSD